MSEYSDEEMGSASTSSSTRMLSEDVFVRMNLDSSKLWEEKVGTRPIQLGHGPIHDHPLLAASRFVLEREACEHAIKDPSDIVLDVGAAPKRTDQYLGAKGRYLMPNLQPGDTRRYRDAPRGTISRICDHKIEDCRCYSTDSGFDQPTSLLFVHSAYYVDPLDLWRLCSQANVVSTYVVGHVFNDPFGGFYNECTWQMSGDVVTMKVKGQQFSPYHHRLLPWNSGWRGPNGEAFEVECLRNIMGFTYLWEVHPILKIADVPRWIDDATVDEPFIGPVAFSSDQRGSFKTNSAVQHLQIDLDRVYRCGSALYTNAMAGPHRVLVTIPITMLSQGRITCAGRARDPSLWSDLVNQMKKSANSHRIPPGLKSEAVLFAACLAFVMDLRKEIDAIHTMHNRFGALYRPLNELVSFQIPKIRSACLCASKVLCLLLILSVVSLVLASQVASGTEETEWISITLLIFLLAVCLIACCMTCVHRGLQAYNDRSLQDWQAAYRNGTAITVPDDLRVPLISRGLPGSNNIAPIAPPDRDASITIGVPPDRDSFGRHPNRLQLVGLAPDTAVTTVIQPDQEADLSALTNRLLISVSEVEIGAYCSVLARFDTLFTDGRPPSINFSRSAFKPWILAQRKKFPKMICDKWEKTFGELTLEDWPVRNAAKPFVKIEKVSRALTRQGQKPVKPRIIAPPSDAHKVIMGPIVTQLYNHLRRMWDGSNKVFYTTGTTADQIGAAVDDYLHRHPDAAGIWIDGSNFDTTFQLLQQLGYLEMLERIGFTPQHIAYLIETQVVGTTNSNVSFTSRSRVRVDGWPPSLVARLEAALQRWKIPYITELDGSLTYPRIQMISGRMDTNLADTTATVTVMETALASIGISDYLMLACGDDSFVLVPSIDQAGYDSILSIYNGFGFQGSGGFGTDRSKWEYCSKLFWYGQDPSDGTVHTVLGPKVGRVIARFGYMLDVPNQTNVAGAAIGLNQDAHHVPFVRVLATRTMELCKEAKIRPKHGRAEWEYQIHTSRAYRCCPENWHIVSRRYDMVIEQEDQYRNLLANLSNIPTLYHWEPIEDMVEVDSA